MYDIIAKKRDGKALSETEIHFFITEFTNGNIPDYQASALLMAIYFSDMTDEERAVLTMAMAESGDQIDLSAIEGIKVDKHSTGGVGDTTTLVLAPLVASVGVPVAKMSGRGLGHTGGTIDKLEAIQGFNVDISTDDFIGLVNENKLAVVGQTGNLTPADKSLYSLRDVTATVNSIPLIASSIMSKKIASGADAIVLDVKAGSGAFMEWSEDAKELAEAMVAIGNRVGKNTMAVISDMNQPLGYAVGNALEIREAIDTLKGEGPADLTELCLILGSQMVVLAGHSNSAEEARNMLEEQLQNGNALEQFKTFIKAQGGDASVVDDPNKLPEASYKIKLTASSKGTISAIDCNEVGVCAAMLGAGRTTKESQIDLSVGIVLHKKLGDQVHKDEPLATLHTNTSDIGEVKQKLYNSIHITSHKTRPPTLVHDIITGD